VPEDFYPAQASNPLMGELLSIGLRWKTRTQAENIRVLTEAIDKETKLYKARTQQLEAKRKLAQELVKSCDITPIHLARMRVKNAWLAELIEQERELQNLEYQSKKLDKQIEVAEKERKLEELKRPSRRRLSRREQEEREIKRIFAEEYSKFRKRLARVDAINQAAEKAKAHVRKRYQDNPQLLEEMMRKIDLWKDDATQFIGTEYEEDENIL
jgi:hypothetical protein